MTLADYDSMFAQSRGDPTPVDAIALVFRDGRACVCVRIYGSELWREIMSAPGNSEEGLACGMSLRIHDTVTSSPVHEEGS